jgi:predicted membrane-bound spermidine synthase
VNRGLRLLAVLALSASTLAYQILLVRVFAIEQFHHFATMAVGVAMLGIGVAGTAFSLAAARGRPVPDRWFASFAALTAASLLLSPHAAGLVQVDPAVLLWDPREWLPIAWISVTLALPFAFGALAVLTALARTPGQPGLLYGASLAGAGAGAISALVSLWLVSPPRAIGIPAVIGAAGALAAAGSSRHPRQALLVAATLGLIAVVPVLRPPRPWPRMLPYKSLAQVLAYPGARVVGQHTHPAGWMIAVDAPAFRHLPGLSLAYRGAFPTQTALLVDGDLVGARAAWNEENSRVLEWQPAYLPFAFGPRPRVLILQDAAGLAVPTALYAGAQAVTVVDLHPGVLGEVRASLATGGLDTTRVRWISGSAREYAARSRERFDLVTVGLRGTSLQEDFSHTVEAYVRYLERLADGGVLAITVPTSQPPRAELRVLLTVAEALRRLVPSQVPLGVVVVRTWGTLTVLATPDGFTEPQLAALRFWSHDRLFDLEWWPGQAHSDLRFNTVHPPVVYEAARAASAGPGSARAFAASYSFDVAPVPDARPYPHQFVGLGVVRWLLGQARGDWLPFAEWGPVALAATLVQSALLAALCMGLPAAVRAGRPPPPSQLRLLGYFGAIGVAFLAVEIAAIQQLTLLLGHPVYAVTAVLAGLLVAAGIGSVLSDRLAPHWAPRATLVLGLLLAGYAIGLLPLVQGLQSTAAPVRAVAAVLVLAPAALLMGAPFPLGVRALAVTPRRLAWAWAANGFASVVTAPAAALLALQAGHRVVLAAGAVAYALAAAAIWTGRTESTR